MSRILVIDDDPAVLGTVRKLLERDGHEVLVAQDGKEGMRIVRARSEEIDLVVTDLIMPEQEGIETIMALQEEFPRLKILAMSGGGAVDPSGPLADARLLGAGEILAKPFSLEQLREAVDRLLEG